MSNSEQNRPGNRDGVQAPPKLIAALKGLRSQRIFVPPTVDEAVLRAAREHLVQPQHSRCGLFRFWLFRPATATAYFVLIASMYFFTKQLRGPAFAREDINQDGSVDILDAFQLAREVRWGPVAKRELDLNGDGVIDQRDAAQLAVRAVKLAKGGRL
jgi:hypothetical protein